MTNYTLYLHIVPNGKVYVGITSVPVKERWLSGHGYRNNPYFQNAIIKYGWDNIEHIIILEHLSKEWACQLEKLFIQLYRSNNKDFGYNLTTGGEGTAEHKLTEASRQLLSESHKGYVMPQSQKDKISASNKGREVSEETRRKISESIKQWHSKQETKEKISKAMKGRVVSEETRRKMSEAHKGKVSGMKGKHHSEETKEKISMTKRQEWM